MSSVAATKTSSNTQVEEERQDSDDDPKEEGGVTKEIRPDHLWVIILSVKPTPSPNLQKFIYFLFSISCSNAYVESVF
jgi:hypothetical protein